jgi:ferric-dicitrate binding protein FerR (iron transport regulator)
MTDKMDARVLGTEINVSAYPGENGHVALLRGSVVITSHRLGNSVKLIPGQGATLADNGTLTVKPENMEKYLRWKEGYLYFDDTPLTDVATTLSRWYNVDIVFDNPSLRQARIHFSCDRNESLPRVIELINHIGYFQAALKGDVLHFSEEK